MLDSLKHFGWTMLDPVRLLDHFGHLVVITEASPKAIRQHAKAAIAYHQRKAAEHRMIEKYGDGRSDEQVAVQHGLHIETARKVVHSKHVQYDSKRAIVQMLAGSYPLAHRLRRMRIPVAPECPICKAHVDSIQHRIWECQGLDKQRSDAFTAEDLAWAREHPNSMLAAIGIGTNAMTFIPEEDATIMHAVGSHIVPLFDLRHQPKPFFPS